MSWFYLALLAPFLYAIVVLFDDSLLRYVYKTPYIGTITSGLFGALPLVALIFRPLSISTELAVLAIFGGLLTISYYFFYFKGLAVESPSIVIALFSLAPATIPFLAYFLVGERLQAEQLIGLIIILFASFGLASVDIKKLKFSRALVPILIAVLLMDILSVVTKHVYQESEFFSAYMFFCLGMGCGGLLFLSLNLKKNLEDFKGLRKILKKVIPLFIVAELINLAAEFTLNLAISRGPVSLVKAIEGLQPMLVLVIALVLYPVAPKFFREAEEGGVKRKLFFMLMAAVGLALIASTENL